MELKVTKEKVLEAAAQCADAKRVLQVMFPEAFKVDVNLKIGERYSAPGYSALTYLGCAKAAHAYYTAYLGLSPQNGPHIFIAEAGEPKSFSDESIVRLKKLDTNG